MNERGRPKMAKNEVRSVRVSLRLTIAESKLFMKVKGKNMTKKFLNLLNEQSGQ